MHVIMAGVTCGFTKEPVHYDKAQANVSDMWLLHASDQRITGGVGLVYTEHNPGLPRDRRTTPSHTWCSTYTVHNSNSKIPSTPGF